jgi:outer membrane protein assembly factor BamB
VADRLDHAGEPLGRARTAVALVAVAAVGAGGALLLRERAGRDVRGSSTQEFVTTTAPAPVAAPVVAPAGSWPTYGFDARRDRTVVAHAVRPPFARDWTFHGRALLEFPPAIDHGTLFLPTFDGRFYALDAATGRVRWHVRSGRCSWASPAVARGLVVETFLNRPGNCDAGDGGEVVAFTEAGRVRWRQSLPPTESSPLVVGDSVYVGAWDGAVRAYALATGHLRWTRHLGGPIKGSLAAAGGTLYVGDYDGRLDALTTAGTMRWRARSLPRLLGGSGRFYSSPALAYGRVYLGSTDGKVYSYGATSGHLVWATSTGGYVYGSPAVAAGLVLVGSYDRSFYAFDAATGAVRWRFRTNGPISGAASVIDGLVYVSTLRERTYALDVHTGRLVWTFADGKYSPAVTDGKRLYLVGLGRLYALTPARAP